MSQKIAQPTKSEKQVLELLWDQKRPLTTTEIVDLSVNRTWKSSYKHIIIQSLLKKELIRIAGFKKTTKNYARTFEPTMSREEFSILQFTQEQKDNTKTLSSLFAALVDNETDSEVLDQLSDMIEERKRELYDKDPDGKDSK